MKGCNKARYVTLSVWNKMINDLKGTSSGNIREKLDFKELK